MADASIDDLLQAVEHVQALKTALLSHDALFLRISDQLGAIERRLAALEKGTGRAKRP